MDSFSIVAATGFYQLKINHSKTKNKGIGNGITSPKFQVGGHDWAIYYYPQGSKNENSGKYVSVYVALQRKSVDVDVEAKYEFALLDKHGIPVSTSLVENQTKFTSNGYGRGSSKYFKRTKLEKMCIKDNCFVLNVSITITGGSYSDPIIPLLGQSLLSAVKSPQAVHNYKFQNERLQKFWEENKQTDVSFVVGGENFVAHRLILAAHSPVFEAEFCGVMAESNLECITINEMMPLEFKAMLDFMYSGSVPVDEDLSDDEQVVFFQNLLVAADRYAVENLKVLCENKLIDSISLENIFSLLELAEQHNCSELKEECLEFVVDGDNFVPLLLTEGYVKLIQNYPSLLAEIKGLSGK